MRLPSRLISALPLSAAMILGPGALSGCQQRADRGDGQIITVKDLTPEARATIEREAGGATIADLRKVEDSPRGVYYAAEFKRGAQDVELDVGPDGLVYAVEESIHPMELPDAVREAVQRELPTAQITDADKVVTGGVVSYDVDASLRLSRWELSISPSGTVTRKELVETLSKPRP